MTQQQTHGIDYGLGRTNIDVANGIRYGVISQHSLCDGFFDEYEAEYGAASCPKCGNENSVSAYGDTSEVDAAAFGGNANCDGYEEGMGCSDYACHACRYVFDSSEAFPEEPIGHKLENSEYLAVDCLDSDVMVMRSPTPEGDRGRVHAPVRPRDLTR